MNAEWKIKEDAADWECDRQGSELFQLRYFRSLSITDKFRAVENMCETARFFSRKAIERGQCQNNQLK